ncbi:TPA: hypothetical protein U0J94_000313 [Streptococcus suis]|uniref:hypothetical protein n=1 Tax=Streptococcus suis TaxID=1307 RepID=UPI0004206A2F|nr:hypothetical protein [Streptococcus suis]MCB2905674.1 hypothetical protein [Streptococcus suis]MCG9909108.1 hypothetical protein [Streptococcus suis]MCG9933238.1 hypothetical protein [Streptococcus suis]HEL2022724.1 hypothetical protein [Streptococcus suis]HEL2108645.1 hypothetical protein [Streptococcus suis]
MANALLDVTGFDKDKDEAFKLSLNIKKIIAIAEDTFAIFDDVAGEYVEHVGCEITVDGSLCYKILEPYQKVKDKFVRC